MHELSQWFYLIALGSLGLSGYCVAAFFARINNHPQYTRVSERPGRRSASVLMAAGRPVNGWPMRADIRHML